MGLERLIALLEEAGAADRLPGIDAYLVLAGEPAQQQGMRMAEQLRARLPALRLLTHCGGGGFKSQFKKADRSGARYALILGDDELQRGVVGVKFLREKLEQREIPADRLADFLASLN